jgi:hypothetical protein
MRSISVIRLQDVLAITRIREATGVSPRSIIVQGEDFQTVETVLINGSTSPEFAVMSRTSLIAQVPEDQVFTTITDVSVLSANITLTDKSIVNFTLGTRVRTVSGIQRLVQVFLRQLMRTPGSNLFHPRSGGGFRRRVGGIFDRSVTADVAMAVTAARQYVISVQTNDRQIPPSERLLSAELVGVRPAVEEGILYTTIELTSHSGQRGRASLVSS